MFMVVEIVGDTTVRVSNAADDSGLWETGDEAASFASRLKVQFAPRKFQVRPAAKDLNWKTREEGRFTDGTYESVSWVNYSYWSEYKLRYPSHYLHTAKDKTKVAFTESEEKGQLNKKRVMKPGAYLREFYGSSIPEAIINCWAIEHISRYQEPVVEWAHTSDEIEHVYLNGPSSCMSHRVGDYQSSMHPTRVYGAGDLSVAYLKTEDRITARAVCWPAKLQHGRAYGDEVRLIKALEGLGYYRDWDFTGARLLIEEDDDGLYVVPYLDETQAARVEGGYLVIDRRGGVCCSQTNGLSGEVGTPCYSCNERVLDSDARHPDDETWCNECYSENWTYSELMGQDIHNDDVVYAEEEAMTERYRSLHYTYCDNDGEYHQSYDTVLVDVSDREHKTWTQDYFDENGEVFDDKCVSKEYAQRLRDERQANETPDLFDQDASLDAPLLRPNGQGVHPGLSPAPGEAAGCEAAPGQEGQSALPSG